jgi:hypothetical protein
MEIGETRVKANEILQLIFKASNFSDRKVLNARADSMSRSRTKNGSGSIISLCPSTTHVLQSL